MPKILILSGYCIRPGVNVRRGDVFDASFIEAASAAHTGRGRVVAEDTPVRQLADAAPVKAVANPKAPAKGAAKPRKASKPRTATPGKPESNGAPAGPAEALAGESDAGAGEAGASA